MFAPVDAVMLRSFCWFHWVGSNNGAALVATFTAPLLVPLLAQGLQSLRRAMPSQSGPSLLTLLFEHAEHTGPANVQISGDTCSRYADLPLLQNLFAYLRRDLYRPAKVLACFLC